MFKYFKSLCKGFARPLMGLGTTGMLMGLIALPSYGAAPANVIPDPSLEVGTAWVSNNTSVGAVASGVARTGTKAIRLIHNGTGNSSQTNTNITQSNIPGVTPGAEYVYTVYVRGNNVQGNGGGGKPLSVLRWKNSSNGNLAKEMYMWAPYGTYDWIPSTIHLQAPSAATKVDVGFRVWWDVTGGTSYWDDNSLVLREFPNRGSLLASYQAEDGTISNGSIQTNEPDYTGSGFFKPNNNGYVQWTVNGGTGGQRIISMRYAHEGNVKNVELLVNGVSQGQIKPVATGRVSSWASHDWVVNLNPGNNTIRLRAVEYTAGPLFDKIDVYSMAGSGGGETPTVSDPTFNPNGGVHQDSVTVQIASSTPATTIYYTTNGTTPTASSTPYGGPFTLTSTTTVRAIAKRDGYNDSAVVAKTFTIDSGGGGGAQSPYGGSVWQIPGRIQAENYDLGGSGVAYNDTTNGNAGNVYRGDNVDIWTRAADGALYVGTTAAGEWLEYSVNVTQAGQYTLTMPVVTAANNKQFRILMNGADVTGAVAVPNTGNWENWTTVSVPVTLSAGQQVLRLQVDNGSFNIDYLDFQSATTPPPSGGQAPFGGTPWAVPGIIQAENYDTGGANVAYSDSTNGNAGNIYRNDGVDLWSAEGDGNYMVGATAAGEWLEYTVNVASAGSYTLNLRVATAASGKQLRVLANGADVTGAVAVPNTGGWTNWQTVSRTVNLSAGQQVLRLQVDSGSFNVDYLQLLSTSTPPPGGGQTAFGGTPWSLPGTIQAENYDQGGAGVAYNDTTAGNGGNIYRSDDVDIWGAADVSGDYMVGATAAGEWLEYTVNVAQAGTYTLNLRVATAASNKRLRVLMNGTDVTGAITVPNTGGWTTWQTISRPVTLSAGQQVLRLQVDAGSFNINWLSVTQ
ncbi:MAG: carbohydrate-binding protein [Gammaproteobacteria bacterium]|nr:carbohydrate-binding protein [Gammaproteobacteria bacterium]